MDVLRASRYTQRMRRLLLLIALTSCACGSELDGPRVAVSRQALDSVTGFGTNPGGLNMWLHSPPQPAKMPALVVAMHGCTMTAADYEKAGWDTYADQYGFYVLYPEITANTQCFSWFDATQTGRDQGQAASIAQATQFVIAQKAIDKTQVFVTGLSAGGAMAAVMMAVYPDVYASGAIMAGIPYGCATNVVDAATCMAGKTMLPQAWGDLVRAADPGYTGSYPRLAIFQGDSDNVVNPDNTVELMRQWTDVHGADANADNTDMVGPATHGQFQDANGANVVETYVVPGMGHGVAIDAANGCGVASTFMLDVGLCSSLESAKFFNLATTLVDGGQGAGNTSSCSSFGGSAMVLGVLLWLWRLRRYRRT